MSKRHTAADPTANAAVGNITRLAQFDGPIAEDLRRRELLRQQEDAARNARLRRLREQQAGPADGGPV
ncbi:hypothetical protein GUY44_18985 [Pimelobacter simplex]|uniref:hypothetical protein n=1 Tax=Nocardioides simplex TaxID=2045 RepID=UPI00053608B3|nr:hypothetical protein [Pimelobacter simplex]MCG8152577.1 hypothetical protein [Pimelobacter simplex]SFM76712.1 hypothetical protein SAMN05421671_3419 [Pimelobacter simplex]